MTLFNDSSYSACTFTHACSAGMGAVFAFTDAYTANARQVDDPLNGATGGCAAGFLAGIRGM